EVRLLNLGVQQLRLAGTDRVSEILEVIQVGGALDFRLRVLVAPNGNAESAVGHDVHVSLGPEEVPGHRFRGVEPAELAYDRRAVLIHPGDVLGIGSLSLVLVADTAAGRLN